MDLSTFYLLLADLVLLVHLLFVIFVLLGGLLVIKWRRLAWLHLPALVWGLWIEFSHSICPLTPLEIHLRKLAGADPYEGGFIAHYIVPIVYPPGLTPEAQWWIGLFLLGLNLAVYAFIGYARWRNRSRGK